MEQMIAKQQPYVLSLMRFVIGLVFFALWRGKDLQISAH
jgi:hypothetical protein